MGKYKNAINNSLVKIFDCYWCNKLYINILLLYYCCIIAVLCSILQLILKYLCKLAYFKYFSPHFILGLIKCSLNVCVFVS